MLTRENTGEIYLLWFKSRAGAICMRGQRAKGPCPQIRGSAARRSAEGERISNIIWYSIGSQGEVGSIVLPPNLCTCTCTTSVILLRI